MMGFVGEGRGAGTCRLVGSTFDFLVFRMNLVNFGYLEVNGVGVLDSKFHRRNWIHLMNFGYIDVRWGGSCPCLKIGVSKKALNLSHNSISYPFTAIYNIFVLYIFFTFRPGSLKIYSINICEELQVMPHSGITAFLKLQKER